MISAKIMIVEDNITVASDIRDCLETFNYTVTSIKHRVKNLFWQHRLNSRISF